MSERERERDWQSCQWTSENEEKMKKKIGGENRTHVSTPAWFCLTLSLYGSVACVCDTGSVPALLSVAGTRKHALTKTPTWCLLHGSRCGSISKNFSNCNALARKQWPGNSSHTLQRLYTGRDYNSVELTFLFFLLFGFADVWLKTAETRGQTWKCRFAGENNSKLRVTAP